MGILVSILAGDGELYAWGNGACGQLGTGQLSNTSEPKQLQLDPCPPNDVAVSGLACGSRHTMVLLTNGQVYAFGNNFYAQLGYDFRKETYKENQASPGLLRYLMHYQVTQVACGDKHTLFLFQDGTVSAVGHNSHGQIGDGGRQESVVPKPVDIEATAVSIACGQDHNLVLTDSGDVYVWGYCKGCGHRKNDALNPELKLQGRQVVQVAGGATHSLALTVSVTFMTCKLNMICVGECKSQSKTVSSKYRAGSLSNCCSATLARGGLRTRCRSSGQRNGPAEVGRGTLTERYSVIWSAERNTMDKIGAGLTNVASDWSSVSTRKLTLHSINFKTIFFILRPQTQPQRRTVFFVIAWSTGNAFIVRKASLSLRSNDPGVLYHRSAHKRAHPAHEKNFMLVLPGCVSISGHQSVEARTMWDINFPDYDITEDPNSLGF
ncbi:hypothetical protein RRG08_028849 [Elysia crispata]|uniref:RCC1-like domain-containing protein n=1 Tax=Elysia crispata TaxID=231223 RepID=A0AAE0YZB8_9GAST|nr:hypothetical protein RRG08_028849 [Elysia crispata]